MALLTGYAWPGNIRELQNVVERAVLLSDGQTVGAAQLPREVVGEGVTAPDPGKSESTLHGYEKAMVVRALKENGWNQTRAAKTLGISRDNLRYRMKKYEIGRDGV
jgi:DNA-binding NtrC family response regulator